MSDVFKIIATKKQQEAHRILQDNSIVLFGGSIRGSKSYWLCMEAITLSFQYPNSRWLMCRSSWSNIESKLLVTFTENFIKKGLNKYIVSFSNNVITFNNGSQIVFMAESYYNDKELNKFRGLEINGAFIDEVNEIQEETFNKIIERSGSWFHSPKCPTKIAMSCNPTQNWVKKRFYEPYKKDQLPNEYAYVPAKITDNPHVPLAYLESLKLLPTYEYEIFVNGNWDWNEKNGFEFYKCFEFAKHCNAFFYDPKLPIHISFDENVNPYLPCNVWQYVGNKAICIDEITAENPNNTVDWLCNHIKQKYQHHQSGVFIYGDATSQKQDTKLEKGQNFFTLIMSRLSIFKPIRRVPGVNPNVNIRGQFINTILEKEIYGLSIGISENCKKTIEDFMMTTQDTNGSKAKQSVRENNISFQKYGHLSDCADYFLLWIWSQEFIKWKNDSVVPIARNTAGKLSSRNGY